MMDSRLARSLVGSALIALGLLALTSRAAPAQKPAKPGPPASIVEGKAGKACDRLVQDFDRGEGGFCGVALVAHKGKPVLAQGYGLADKAKNVAMPHDALYDWASVSKQFTAGAMMRLIEASRMKPDAQAKLKPKSYADALKKWKNLDLADPISRFFPKAPEDKAKVTLRQLLDHTSGIEAGFQQGWNFDSSSRESFERLVLGLPMTSKPGEKFAYSNSGYAFVAAIIERVSGMSFEAFCAEQVFAPAGMKDATMIGFGILDPKTNRAPFPRVPRIDRGTGFTDRPQDFSFAYGNTLNWGYRGCGGIVATTHDMLAWDRALRDPKYLSPKLRDQLWGDPVRADHGQYALGWYVDSRDPLGSFVWHSGGVQGVVTYYLRFLEADVVVALACSYRPKDNLYKLAHDLAVLAGT